MATARELAEMGAEEIRAAVAARYGGVAADPGGSHGFPVGRAFAAAVGYSAEDLGWLPDAASASFAGIAAPLAWAELVPGERVVDLGCGAGMDTLLAARAVGPSGHVTGVDLSPEMATLARANAAAAGLDNVEIVVAPVELLPLADASADVVLANGVFNLAPGKAEAMREAFRTLRPGGRLAGAEIVLTEDIPREERGSLDDWFRWIGGALPEAAFTGMLRATGFEVTVLGRERNARTANPRSVVLRYRAVKPPGR